MINNFALNYVFVVLFMSLITCLNVENNIEEDDLINPVMDDIFGSANSKSNEKIAPRIEDTKNENNTSDNRDFVDYTNITDITSKVLNEIDDDNCDSNSYWRIGHFRFAREKQDDDSEDNCNDCIPGLMKGEIYSNRKGFDKVYDQSNSSKHNLANKREIRRKKNSSMNYQHNELITPDLLNIQENSTSNVFGVNNTVNLFRPEKPVFRVVNGRPAELGDVPYQVSFKMLRSRYKKEYVSFCGGVIIGPTKLVSAAHCFETKKKGSPCQKPKSRKADKKTLRAVQVVAGNLKNVAMYKDGGQWRSLRSMYYPAKYKFPKKDISVGYVTRRFQFNAHVNKVPFEKKFVDYNQKVCLVSGYGRISKYQMSDKLLLADLTILSNEVCSKLHHRKMKDFICTDNVPSDIEKGDSGGPLVCSGTLVGIVSGHRYGSGSFFTRVSTHSKYIAAGKATALTHNHLVNFIHICFVIFTI